MCGEQLGLVALLGRLLVLGRQQGGVTAQGQCWGQQRGAGDVTGTGRSTERLVCSPQLRPGPALARIALVCPHPALLGARRGVFSPTPCTPTPAGTPRLEVGPRDVLLGWAWTALPVLGVGTRLGGSFRGSRFISGVDAHFGSPASGNGFRLPPHHHHHHHRCCQMPIDSQVTLPNNGSG